jgi:hypothetical protein
LVLGWRPADKAVVLEDISVTLDEVGRIQASGRLDEADLVAAITDYGKPASLLGRSPTVRRLELAVSDLGFADRFYADVARSSGVARDAVPGSLAEDLTAKVDKDFGKVLAPGSIDALAAFIRRPGRITATVVPRAGQPPVTVDDLQTLGPEALDRLTITIATGAAR